MNISLDTSQLEALRVALAQSKLEDKQWALRRFELCIKSLLSGGGEIALEGIWFTVNRRENIIRCYKDMRILIDSPNLRNKEIWVSRLEDGKFASAFELNIPN